MHVTSDTLLTTIDRNQDIDIDVSVPLEHATELKEGLPIEVVGAGGDVIARSSIYFVSRRVDDRTQGVLVKGKVPASSGVRSAQYVRARRAMASLRSRVIACACCLSSSIAPMITAAPYFFTSGRIR